MTGRAMRFSDWINSQIVALRSMIGSAPPESAGGGSPNGVAEKNWPDRMLCSFSSSPANLASVRKAVERFCKTTSLDEPARDEIGLVVNEALANVTRHAYGCATDKPVELRAEHFKDGIRIAIRDWGNGVKPVDVSEAEKDPMIPGGLGLICMKRLMDDAQFFPEPDGMRLVLTRTTSGSKAATVD